VLNETLIENIFKKLVNGFLYKDHKEVIIGVFGILVKISVECLLKLNASRNIFGIFIIISLGFLSIFA